MAEERLTISNTTTLINPAETGQLDLSEKLFGKPEPESEVRPRLRVAGL